MNDRLFPARHWHREDDGRIRCDLCPQRCLLKDGQRGLCWIRLARDGAMWLESYGVNSGLAVDPIEKKPLYHFFPGSTVLSFGTSGCNLRCRFCQNWHLSAGRGRLPAPVHALPGEIARIAEERGVRSVAFTYNDPVVFLEYAVDTARECHRLGIKTVAVTAAEILPGAREEFFSVIDAANIDLKSFRDGFYRKLCGAPLAPVLDCLHYLAHETSVFFEITVLLIPGENDDPEELDEMTRWIASDLGREIPVHFSAFFPAYRMMDHPPTPAATLLQSREIARSNGLRFVYTGNIIDPASSATICPECGEILISRTGYHTTVMAMDQSGRCEKCGYRCPGCF